MFYCGIDIDKYKHGAAVIDESGIAQMDGISFGNSNEGCEKLVAVFEKLDISKDDLLIGMEATGHYWLSVYRYLLERGFEVRVINPIQSVAFRKMYIRQAKNDRKDSFIVAQIMRFGQFSVTNLSEEVIVAMRQLSRYRLALVDACGDCKRRVIALLEQVFPEYDTLFSDTFGVTSKEVLSQYTPPEELLSVSTRKLSNLLEKASHGRFGKEKAEQLKAAAASSFGVSFAKDVFAFQTRQLIGQLEFLERQVAELDKQISSLLKQTSSYITTIPGIGDILGAIIPSEIGGIHRFDAPNKLVAFAGLEVRVTQSGEFTGTRQKISKRGSPYLRRAIWLAASRAAFCDTILSKYYQGLKARGKHHFTAIGAISRKLCNTIYTIFKEGRPWQPIPPKWEIIDTLSP